MAAPSPCSTTPRRDSYQRRRPDETRLYQLIEEHWPTFLERAEQAGGLPDFIVEEFEAYLRCGMLEHGLAHFVCRQCGESLVVAFSCKRRGLCPSCLGRRMSDVAAHLIDEVFPEVPVRQWVCSLPWRLRYAMGYDRKLCADVLDAFIVALPTRPTTLGMAGTQLMDVDGDGRKELVSFVAPAPGFFRRTEQEGWGSFRAFCSRIRARRSSSRT
ncbi:transposase zinc-binding domain-containing protein [Enhygromyxa salina]|uniref:Transposase zinc-binding domain-containing protein n=1 Tax=Enhygromyxa salina TaxID=215803 RepID=A0A2S9YP53_9BACT|nr:transposase zinc-binding domain-containing protein [Enhygromyxa salina]PRQ06849.1 hypothetical protein ENSA7_33870 [Enhygromyxa salina]